MMELTLCNIPKTNPGGRLLAGFALALAAMATAAVLVPGGVICYRTNGWHAYLVNHDQAERRAAYERRYGKFRNAPQPRLSGAKLHVELYPAGRRAEVRGTYRLLNRSGAPIDTIHLLTYPDVETAVRFDRPARVVLADAELGHRSYALARPLGPGDSLHLHFTVQYRAPALPLHGLHMAVADHGASSGHRPHRRPLEKRWLPLPGYQPAEELSDAGTRRAHGLPPRRTVRSHHDPQARQDRAVLERIPFEAVLGTDADRNAPAHLHIYSFAHS
ncbi:MAG: hypothetical protein ICV83_17900 [Cytophagales bacterium]|nr:hypothetical protein [Cytophagales bacterium]